MAGSFSLTVLRSRKKDKNADRVFVLCQRSFDLAFCEAALILTILDQGLADHHK